MLVDLVNCPVLQPPFPSVASTTSGLQLIGFAGFFVILYSPLAELRCSDAEHQTVRARICGSPMANEP